MTRQDLARFAARVWSAVDDDKARYWAGRKRTMSPADALRLGEVLRRHARGMRPDWPSDDERQADLDTHVRVARALRAVTGSSL
jgi:hypothetical protein